MMNYPNKKSRQRAAADSSFKAHIYKTTGARLFIESSKQQAQEIAQMTGRYVFCTSSHTLIEPHFLGRVAEKVKEEVHKTRTYPILRLRAFLKLLRWWITKT
jgi:orotate phosphoribosyltransferase